LHEGCHAEGDIFDLNLIAKEARMLLKLKALQAQEISQPQECWPQTVSAHRTLVSGRLSLRHSEIAVYVTFRASLLDSK
jgi:hypothetical protein